MNRHIKSIQPCGLLGDSQADLISYLWSINYISWHLYSFCVSLHLSVTHTPSIYHSRTISSMLIYWSSLCSLLEHVWIYLDCKYTFFINHSMKKKQIYWPRPCLLYYDLAKECEVYHTYVLRWQIAWTYLCIDSTWASLLISINDLIWGKEGNRLSLNLKIAPQSTSFIKNVVERKFIRAKNHPLLEGSSTGEEINPVDHNYHTEYWLDVSVSQTFSPEREKKIGSDYF